MIAMIKKKSGCLWKINKHEIAMMGTEDIVFMIIYNFVSLHCSYMDCHLYRFSFMNQNQKKSVNSRLTIYN